MRQVVRLADVDPQRWSNGGGETRELLVDDEGGWRVSLADVVTEGPFSSFPGRRRLLTVVEGTVLTLVVDGSKHVVEARRPFAFDGDLDVTARLPEGPVRVLNVVFDPSVVQPSVTVLELGRSSSLPIAGDQAAMVIQGRALVDDHEAVPLDLVVGPGALTGRCTLAVVSMTASG